MDLTRTQSSWLQANIIICIAQTCTMSSALCAPGQACSCNDSSVDISFIFSYFVYRQRDTLQIVFIKMKFDQNMVYYFRLSFMEKN